MCVLESLTSPKRFTILPNNTWSSCISIHCNRSFFFHQIHLVETKSWSIALFAYCYPFFALSVIGITFATGWLVDRFSTIHLLRFFLLPLAFGLLILASTDSTYVAPVFMILMGISSGAATVIISSIWVELFMELITLVQLELCFFPWLFYLPPSLQH